MKIKNMSTIIVLEEFKVISKLKLKNFLLDKQYEAEKLNSISTSPTSSVMGLCLYAATQGKVILIDKIFEAIEEGRLDA